MLDFLIALTLQGGVQIDDRPGRIGVRINALSNTVAYVYKGSPAHIAGLRRKDQIIKGANKLTGPSGELITITVKRGKQIIQFELERIPNEECSKEIVKE